MSDQFLAEIRMFACNFAPLQWALCDGQLLSISQNAALFSLIGTSYGGNGTSTFQLPNLQGRVPLSTGQGNGLSLYVIGEEAGEENHTLIDAENARHNHNINADKNVGNSASPAGAIYSKGAIPGGGTPVPVAPYSSKAPDVTLNAQTLSTIGGNQPHNNMMPYLTINFCIALQGIFPPRG
jgi:microcystin-dependent protein